MWKQTEMRLALAVFLGAGIGGLGRMGVNTVATAWWGAHFPWGILLINCAGSFLIGLLATLSAPEGRFYLGPAARQFAMTGFCGGFTTFSFFSLETLLLLEAGRPIAALSYSLLTLILALTAVWLGHRVAKWLNR